MELEGLYTLKEACYTDTTVNPPSVTCSHGSPWTETAQSIMGGDISWANADIVTDDNFHRVYTCPPFGNDALPSTTTCDDQTANSKCTLESISVTENYYSKLEGFDTGKYPIAALEQKAKLLSRQSVQIAAGNKTADYHENEDGNLCAEINQAALDLALKTVSSKALDKYNKLGKKLVMGDDLEYDIDPQWIWTYMKYEDNDDKTETTLQSPMSRYPYDYIIGLAAGFHFCKLLSPFRAVEWIYVDALYDRDGYSSNASNDLQMFLQ